MRYRKKRDPERIKTNIVSVYLGEVTIGCDRFCSTGGSALGTTGTGTGAGTGAGSDWGGARKVSR